MKDELNENVTNVTEKQISEYKKPTTNQFVLDKVKLIKSGGLDVHYTISVTVGDEIYNNKFHLESAMDIHPDLRKLFKSLNVIVARTFGLTSFLSCVESSDFNATSKQKTDAREFAAKLLDRIEVKGVTFNGQDDNVSVIITSMLSAGGDERGDKTASAINTPKLRYALEKYGFEQELESIAADIEHEVYLYLYEGKKAQLELFDGETSANDLPFSDDENEGEENEPESDEF